MSEKSKGSNLKESNDFRVSTESELSEAYLELSRAFVKIVIG